MAKCLLYKNIATIFSMESKGNYKFSGFQRWNPIQTFGEFKFWADTNHVLHPCDTFTFKKKTAVIGSNFCFWFDPSSEPKKKQTRRTFSQLKHDNLVKHVFLLNPLHFSPFKLVYPRLLQVLLWAVPIWSNQVQAPLQRSTRDPWIQKILPSTALIALLVRAKSEILRSTVLLFLSLLFA